MRWYHPVSNLYGVRSLGLRAILSAPMEHSAIHSSLEITASDIY